MPTRVIVTLSRGDDSRKQDLYAAALRAAGLDAIEVRPGDRMPDSFAALCLTGGADIDAARYGEPRDARAGDPDAARDELELSLLARALADDLPVLAICRGLQLLNVHLGGSLEQHRAGHRAKDGPVVPHVVRAKPGSRLARAIGDAPCAVNSSHHQAVTAARLAPGLEVTARIDEVVEAFELPAHRWVVGVQWHPERTTEVAPAAVRIFDAFAAEASSGR